MSEIGRVRDDRGRIAIVGTDGGRVTLRTLRTRTSGAVELDEEKSEYFGQLFVSACWQAAEARAWAQAAAAAGGAP